MTFFVPRIQPGDDGAWQNSSRVIAFPPPLDWGAGKSRSRDHPASDAALLLGAGLPAPILQQIAALALRWGVPLHEAALSVGAVKSHAYTRELADRCGFTAAPHQVRLRALDVPLPLPYRHLSAPLPMPLDEPQGVAALNGEQLSLSAATELAASLGAASDRLMLVGRRALSDAITEAYGPGLAREAENSLSRKQPRFSAATGLNGWQCMCLALMGGLFAGAVVFAPREALVIYSAMLSLMFLLTISLRLAAAGHAAHTRAGGSKRQIARLKDADLASLEPLGHGPQTCRTVQERASGRRGLWHGSDTACSRRVSGIYPAIMACRDTAALAHYSVVSAGVIADWHAHRLCRSAHRSRLTRAEKKRELSRVASVDPQIDSANGVCIVGDS